MLVVNFLRLSNITYWRQQRKSEVIYLITAFQKKSQENLTEEEKSILKKLVKSLREEAAKNRR